MHISKQTSLKKDKIVEKDTLSYIVSSIFPNIRFSLKARNKRNTFRNLINLKILINLDDCAILEILLEPVLDVVVGTSPSIIQSYGNEASKSNQNQPINNFLKN